MKHSLQKMVLGVAGVLALVAAQSASAIEVIEVREHGFLRSTDRQITAQAIQASDTIGREMLSRISESVMDLARRNLANTPVFAVERGMHYAQLAR
ncbi:MAG: hypothetical protein HYV16_12925 [Gammaproteobacteria bacterium]|nr:hypothetical protein [Gammaproteobacteria bacterium]